MTSAAVRFVVDLDHLDHAGWFRPEAIRELRALLCDIPARARLTVDLGPMGRVDPLLTAELRALPVGPSLVVESRDWRLAQKYAEAISSSDAAVV